MPSYLGYPCILSMKGTAILLVCSFLSFNLLITSNPLDTLNATQWIRDGETIVSKSEQYELGFFSPGGSSKRYLGIWYKKLSVKTVVWVANREMPLNSSLGVLKLTGNGILVLQNHDGDPVWSSNSSRPAYSPVAKLLDSGNLVVKDENANDPLWQSFDYPGDTFLPGMKLGRDLVTGLNRYMSSWKSPDDPSHGNFTYGFDLQGFPDWILKAGSTIEYRSGPWNGLRFSGTPELRPNPVYRYGFVFNEKEVYYSYELLDSSVLSWVVLNPNGVVQRFTWIDRKQGWVLYLTVQVDNCDDYAMCGAYGSCNINKSPVCSCLRGFEPKFQKEWDMVDWSNGCIRKTPLNCSVDGFLNYSGVKLPDTQHSWFNYSINLKECRGLCKKNCSCTAYANLDIREGGSGCLLWFGDLVDIREYSENGQQIFIRMAASELDKFQNIKSKEKGRMRIKVISVFSAAMLILGLALGVYLWRKKYYMIPGLQTFAHESGSNVQSHKEDIELPLFSLAKIVFATDNFSTQNILGQGGFGSVYKGILKNGQEIAVKRLSKTSRQGIDEFKNEVMHIAKLQHRNLVKLLGCCIQGDEKMLIYEFMPNKSLDFFIFDQCQSMPLSWPMRYHIINGIARGLLYLHQDSRQRIIHRDMKAGNILLDSDMNPKISDFGLARSFEEKETAANTNRVVGTYGYMAPEYAIDGLYSIKSDVFSFGVLVLEIVSGKRNRGFCHPDHQLNLLGHAWKLFGEGKSLELIASPIKEISNPTEALRSIHVGLLCVQRKAEDRPNMANVVLMLCSQGPLPQPKQPGFFTERDLAEADSSSMHHALLSSNDFTITELNAR